jgi:nickel superoxide dismutase
MLTRKMCLLMALALFMPVMASAHCQIPCGIYNDQMRFDMLNEDIATIEKSMISITNLSANETIDYNQLVRWIDNKEEHAQKFMDIVTAYFMAQRIKPVDPADAAAHADYLKKVELLHNMLVYAMKCKQTTDPGNTAKLTELVKEFHDLYMGEDVPEHQH